MCLYSYRRLNHHEPHSTHGSDGVSCALPRAHSHLKDCSVLSWGDVICSTDGNSSEHAYLHVIQEVITAEISTFASLS